MAMMRTRRDRTTRAREAQKRRAVEFDRLWFVAHPAADRYCRPLVRGEFGFDERERSFDLVLVEQVAPGFRVRSTVRRVAWAASDRIAIIDVERGRWLPDVPLVEAAP
jgi:hypothetical protein